MLDGHSEKFKLHPQHLDDLRKSGLSDETIAANKFATWTDEIKIGAALNWNGQARGIGPCLCLPYFTLAGDLIETFLRFRPLPENRPTLKGQKAKYISPKGGGVRLYFPNRSRNGRLQDASTEIIIVEGEKKAAILDQLGYTVIGLCGVSCWSAPRKKNEAGTAKGDRELHPDFAGIPLEGRTVYICFDADIGSKPSVAHEERALALELEHSAKAIPRCIRIPDDYDSDKVGVDDYLAAERKKNGRDSKEVVDDLLAAAVKSVKPEYALKNYKIIEQEKENAKEDEKKTEEIEVPISADAIAASLLTRTRGWPRRVAGSLFVRDGDAGPLWIENTSALFAYCQRSIRRLFLDAPPVSWKSRGDELVSEAVFFSYLRQTATKYEAVESSPHEPRIKGHYYIHPPIKGGDGKALHNLLSRFSPATDADAWLILALALTLIWGGPYGCRPAFLITGLDDDRELGRGIGKTTLVKLLARLVGGVFEVRPGEDWTEFTKRILSDTASSTQRVVLLDNVKTMRLSWADAESLVTCDHVTGRKLYAGNGSRPNIFTLFITLNGASLSKDFAQRCIVVKLNRPTHTGDWENETAAFIDRHRWEIIGDLMAHLKRPRESLTKFTRWGAWERDVLCRLPDPESLQKLIVSRRDEVDVDGDEAITIREAIVEELSFRGHDPVHGAVRIPGPVMCEIVCKVANERMSATAVTSKVRMLSGAIRELKHSVLRGATSWAWRGEQSKPGAALDSLNPSPAGWR